MDRKYNSKKNDSITNNDLQNTTQQLKVEQHEPYLKQEMNPGYQEG